MILQDELFDEHELGGHGGAHKQPVLLREDLNGGGGRNGGSLLRENEALLQQVIFLTFPVLMFLNPNNYFQFEFELF